MEAACCQLADACRPDSGMSPAPLRSIAHVLRYLQIVTKVVISDFEHTVQGWHSQLQILRKRASARGRSGSPSKHQLQ